MNEAEARYLEEIAEDCRAVLGAGIELDGISVEVGALTVIAASYHVAAHAARTVGRGETIVAAHADLRRRLVEDRLGIAFAALVDPARAGAGAPPA
jgi:hypothetical protein